MARPHLLRRILFRVALGLFAVMLIFVLAIQIQLHILRNRAEHLLADIQSLELRKTSWQEAQQLFSKWRQWTKYDPSCNGAHCSFGVILRDLYFQHIGIVSRLDDFADRHPKLFGDPNVFMHAYIHMGGRPAIIFAQVGMHDGVVWEKDYSADLHVLGHEPNSPFDDYSLHAVIETKSQLSNYSEEPRDLILHPNFTIDKAGACEGCVLGWAYFTPYADRETIRRLFQVNLSCITSWRSCRSQADIMTGAWPEYLSDDSRLKEHDSFVPCSPERIEVVGRDAENVAVAELLSLHRKLDSARAIIRIVQPLKGAAIQSPTKTEEVLMYWEEIAKENGADSTWEKPGTRLLVSFDKREAPGNAWFEAHECGFIPFSDPNFSSIRRGVAQDYAVSDPPHWYPPLNFH